MLVKPDASITGVSKPAEVAARCHEIQTCLRLIEVPDFDQLRSVGMAVKLSLHIRGLPLLKYETVRLVAIHLLDIPAVAVQSILALLAEVEFVKLQTEGKTIRAVLPNVPYYETLYEVLGTYAVDAKFNEAEQLSIDILSRLSKSPEKKDSLEARLGAETKLVRRAFEIGEKGSYLRVHRSRGRDVILSPTYFSENAGIYADMVAGGGARQIQKILGLIKGAQGIPLSIIQASKEISGISISDEELNMILRLAQDGTVKPPRIHTSYSGDQHFLFTPTPTAAALSPTKRDIYEKAMAIVSAIRQGQFLPQKYAIRSPSAVLNALKNNLKLGKATTEATQQYRNLVHLRIARLEDVGAGFSELRIIDTEENREALDIAFDLISAGVTSGTEVDQDARKALQSEQSFIESIVASGELNSRYKVSLTQEQQTQIENILWS